MAGHVAASGWALKTRGQRLKQDAGRDHPAVELRRAIEELRVSLFTQGLGTAQSVSPKRLAGVVAALS
jgi:hypothetical protein